MAKVSVTLTLEPTAAYNYHRADTGLTVYVYNPNLNSDIDQLLTESGVSGRYSNASVDAGSYQLWIGGIHGVGTRKEEFEPIIAQEITVDNIVDLLPDVNELNRSNGLLSQLAGMNESHAQNKNEITGSGSITDSGFFYYDTTSGAITSTLPEISDTKSIEVLLVFKTKPGANNATIQDHANDAGFVKADGTTKGTSIQLNSVGDFVFLKSSCYKTGYWMILGGEGYSLLGG